MQSSAATGTHRAFGGYGERHDDQRSWGASLATSSAVYLAIGVVIAIVGGRQVARVAEKVVDVTFVQKVPLPPPPAIKPAEIPKAPPKTIEAKAAPPAAAPAVRPDQKIKKLDAPPPPKTLTVPKTMPTEAAPEADPSLDEGVAVYGDGDGDVAGLEGGVAGGLAGAPGGTVAENIEPPTPSATNVRVLFPDSVAAGAKATTVLLRIEILADGSVGSVKLVRGEEPYAAAAIRTVKTWRYRPARYEGKPIRVDWIVQIPFAAA